jgi:hypothetical protein
VLLNIGACRETTISRAAHGLKGARGLLGVPLLIALWNIISRNMSWLPIVVIMMSSLLLINV